MDVAACGSARPPEGYDHRGVACVRERSRGRGVNGSPHCPPHHCRWCYHSPEWASSLGDSCSPKVNTYNSNYHSEGRGLNLQGVVSCHNSSGVIKSGTARKGGAGERVGCKAACRLKKRSICRECGSVSRLNATPYSGGSAALSRAQKREIIELIRVTSRTCSGPAAGAPPRCWSSAPPCCAAG